MTFLHGPKLLLGVLVAFALAVIVSREVLRALREGEFGSSEAPASQVTVDQPLAFLAHLLLYGVVKTMLWLGVALGLLLAVGVHGSALAPAALLPVLAWVVVIGAALAGERSRPLVWRPRAEPVPPPLFLGLRRLAQELGGRPEGRFLSTRLAGRDAHVEALPRRRAGNLIGVRLSLLGDPGLPSLELAPGDLLASHRLPAWLSDPGVRERARRLLEAPGAGVLAIGPTLRLQLSRAPEGWGEQAAADSGANCAATLRALLEDLRALAETLERVYLGRISELTLSARGLDGAHCPYCRDTIAEEVTACPGCQTQHHTACWEEAGGCTVLGCTQRRRPGERERRR